MPSKKWNNVLWCTVWTATVFLLFSPTVLSQLTINVEYDFDDFKVIKQYDDLHLLCSINETGFQFTWRWDGKQLNDTKIRETFDGHTAELVIPFATHKHTGIYECVAQEINSTLELSAEINVISLPTGKIEDDTMIIEEQTLELDCQPEGVPPPVVFWAIGETNYTESAGRVQILPNDNNVANAVLRMENIQLDDRGEYKCIMMSMATQGEEVVDMTMVRVKDKHAVIWPVIGIVAEVVVLIAFLYVYERRNPESGEGGVVYTRKREKKMNTETNSSHQNSRL